MPGLAGDPFRKRPAPPKEAEPPKESAADFLAALYSDTSPHSKLNIASLTADGRYKGRMVRVGDLSTVEFDDTKNWYFGVNPLPATVDDNVAKANLDHLPDNVRFVQLDIDPEGGLSREQIAAWKRERVEEWRGKCTALIDSGNGLQLVWKLADPVSKADAESINRALCKNHGGDPAATDVVRLLRVPFTVNHPNATKVAKGREACPTTLVEFTGKAWPPSQFRRDVQLKVSLDERIAHTLRTGKRHPSDQRDEYKGESEARFAVLQGLIRQQVDDETIRQLIMNSAVKKKNAPRNDAWLDREIENARKALIPPHVQKFIDAGWNIALVNNKVRIIRREEMPDLKRYVLKALEKSQFKSIHEDRYHFETVQVNGRPRQVKVVHTDDYFSNQLVPRFMDVVVDPRHEGHFKNERDENVYNLWHGYSVRPVNHGGRARDLLKQHYIEVLANGDEMLGRYIWKWLCWVIQNPAKMPKVALGIRGEKGTGKSISIIVPFRLLGNHFVHMLTDSLTDRFNAEQLDALAILADEAVFAGDPRLANSLKGLITESMRLIEMKGIDKVTARNMLALVFISNDPKFLPASDKERRYCITRTSEKYRNKDEYFEPFFNMADGKDDEGLEDLLYWMLKEDLSDFNIRKFPRTRELVFQQKQQLNIVQEWWLEKLKSGCMHRYGLPNLHKWQEIPAEWRYADFLDYCNARRVRTMSPEQFGGQLAALLPETIEKPRQPGVKMTHRRTARMLPKRLPDGTLTKEKELTYIYVIGTLDECREKFVDVMGEGWTLDDVVGQEDDDGDAEF